MLHLADMFSSEIEEVMTKMAESKFEFFLTGSRFFGTASKLSDYDFYTSGNADELKKLRETLVKWGFSPAETAHYILEDKEIDEVFELVATNVCIHVQIVTDLAVKTAAQRALFDFQPYVSRVPPLPSDWKRAYSAIHHYKGVLMGE